MYRSPSPTTTTHALPSPSQRKCSSAVSALASWSPTTGIRITTTGLLSEGDTFDVGIIVTDTGNATSSRTFTFTIGDEIPPPPPDPCADAEVTAPDLEALPGVTVTGQATHDGFPSGTGVWDITDTTPDPGDSIITIDQAGVVTWTPAAGEPGGFLDHL